MMNQVEAEGSEIDSVSGRPSYRPDRPRDDAGPLGLIEINWNYPKFHRKYLRLQFTSAVALASYSDIVQELFSLVDGWVAPVPATDHL